MTKFICCGDLHIRANAPINRKDNYFETVIGKFTQIIDLARMHGADIICAGDFFDHIKVGHTVVNTIISIIQEFKGIMYLVAGQHDLPNHKMDGIKQSPIKTLLFQPNVILLDHQEVRSSNTRLFGCSWGEEIPEIKRNNFKKILVIHKSITPEEPPFFLKEAISAEDMLKSTKFNAVISGDYHVPFVKRTNEKILINCGPMMRQKINEADLKPSVFLFDTITWTCKRIKLKVKPPGDVFILENSIKKNDSKFKKELSDLVNTLKNTSEKPSFKQVVNILIDKGSFDKDTIEKIKGKIHEAEGIKIR